MKIIKLEEVDSTHRYIKDYILENSYKEPLCVFTDYQTQGIGSRGRGDKGRSGQPHRPGKDKTEPGREP